MSDSIAAEVQLVQILFERMSACLVDGAAGFQFSEPDFEKLSAHLDGLCGGSERIVAANALAKFAFVVGSKQKQPAIAQRFLDLSNRLVVG